MPSGSSYAVHPYSAQVLKDVLVRASHRSNSAVRRKPHADYLDGYLREIGARTIVVEHDYVDRDYLEDFAAYHVRCFADYSRFCTRLHFFSRDLDLAAFEDVVAGGGVPQSFQGAYLGFLVAKPLPSTVVGRTCLVTYPLDLADRERSFPTLRTEHANLYGIDLQVRSLPFQEQDKDVAACASSALWSVLNGTSQLFRNATPSPVEITKAAGLHFRLENRHFPAGGGLTSNQIADAIRSVALEPHAIAAKNQTVLKIAALAYLRAGIPCMLLGHLHSTKDGEEPKLLGGHAIAVTGYGQPNVPDLGVRPMDCRFKALNLDRLYCHDDQVGPFSKFRFTSEGLIPDAATPGAGFILKPTVLHVPLYHKIRIPVQGVVDLAREMDTFLEAIRQSGLLPLDERATWDVQLVTLNNLRGALAQSSLDGANKRRLLTRGYPRFLWRMEASYREKPLFEAFLDATDLLQGRHLLDVAPHDKAACRAVAEAAPLLAEELATRPQAAHLFEWFATNTQHFE